jgi:hypothetical protein
MWATGPHSTVLVRRIGSQTGNWACDIATFKTYWGHNPLLYQGWLRAAEIIVKSAQMKLYRISSENWATLNADQ